MVGRQSEESQFKMWRVEMATELIRDKLSEISKAAVGKDQQAWYIALGLQEPSMEDIQDFYQIVTLVECIEGTHLKEELVQQLAKSIFTVSYLLLLWLNLSLPKGRI